MDILSNAFGRFRVRWHPRVWGAPALAFFASPSSAINWQWVNGQTVDWKPIDWNVVDGSYVSLPVPTSRRLRVTQRWRYPLACLDMGYEIDRNCSNGESLEEHRYFILRPEVQEWLQRLGVVSVEDEHVSFHVPYELLFVVRRPSPLPFIDAEYLWCYDGSCFKEAPSGIAAVRLLPLAPGRIAFVEPYDAVGAPGGPRVAALPNGFLLRRLPCEDPVRDNAFWLQIDGAIEDDNYHYPFGFAALVQYTDGRVCVVIEVIPYNGYRFKEVKDIEDHMRAFANADHGIWWAGQDRDEDFEHDKIGMPADYQEEAAGMRFDDIRRRRVPGVAAQNVVPPAFPPPFARNPPPEEDDPAPRDRVPPRPGNLPPQNPPPRNPPPASPPFLPKARFGKGAPQPAPGAEGRRAANSDESEPRPGRGAPMPGTPPLSSWAAREYPSYGDQVNLHRTSGEDRHRRTRSRSAPHRGVPSGDPGHEGRVPPG